jgi:sugar O-acyltransferase (sialic acid O-acetyltransferase NeuD family)
MVTKSLFGVFGTGGAGRGIMPLARWQTQELGAGSELVFVQDEVEDRSVNGSRVLSLEEFAEAPSSKRHLAVAVANSRVRERVFSFIDENDIDHWDIRAAEVVIMDDVTIGEGSILSPFVTVTSNVRIGRGFHGNLYSYVEHDCRLGDFVTFAPRVGCNGNIVIEDHVYVGAGATIKQGTPGNPVVIGKGAVVGMGAVVTKSVDPGVTVVGCPARPM